MSSSSIHVQIIFWLLIVFPLAFSIIFPTNQTLIFPLTTQHIQRRRFSSSPSLKVPFTHDVALTVSLTVGSPAQPITMVLDTGSELSWLNCKKFSTLTKFFNHAESSSYSPLPCSSPVCTIQTRDLTNPAWCDKKVNLCHVAVSYADGSSMDGNLAHETFKIGSSTRPAMAFGCMYSITSTTPEVDAKITGLIGMNRGRLSIVNQMGLSKFSYCISGSESSGVLVLGDALLPPLKYTPMISRTDRLPYFDRFAYTVKFEGIRVGSKLLSIPSSELVPDHFGAGQTMIDSGTQFSFLLDPVYKVLKTEFTKQTKSSLTVDPNFVFQTAMDLCFRFGLSRPKFFALPTVTLIFAGAELTVSGHKLLYLIPGSGPDKKYCFTFGNSGLAGYEAFYIGNYHQQNVWMEFDLAHAKVGFANNIKCDQATKLLGSRL